jgi:serine phosphatase RsbU (regulator of sigma subunit)
MPREKDLAEAMRQVNDLLAEDFPEDRFVTFVAALLDCRHGTVQMLSAGHGPLLHYRAADGCVHDFKAHAPPFGVFPGMAYPSPQEVSLDDGDVQVLITDGFFEWTNPEGEQFGIDRLKTSIIAASNEMTDQVIRQLREDVLAFARSTPQMDDLTAVVIRRRANHEDAHILKKARKGQ